MEGLLSSLFPRLVSSIREVNKRKHEVKLKVKDLGGGATVAPTLHPLWD